MTAEQRADALAKAQQARARRSALLASVKAGEVTLDDVFAKADTDEVIKRTKAVALVKALPGVGAVRAEQILAAVGIADSRRVGGLGQRQREALLAAVAG